MKRVVKMVIRILLSLLLPLLAAGRAARRGPALRSLLRGSCRRSCRLDLLVMELDQHLLLRHLLSGCLLLLLHLRGIVLTWDCTLSPLLGLLLLHEVVHGRGRGVHPAPRHRHHRGHVGREPVHHEGGVPGRVDREDSLPTGGRVRHDARGRSWRGGGGVAPLSVVEGLAPHVRWSDLSG